MLKYVNFALLILVFLIGGAWGPPDPRTEAIEKHYNYLESETKAFRESIQKEQEGYRKFIQEERAEHQKFLERTITYGGFLIALIGVLLTFWGWNTFKGISDARKELEKAAAARLALFNDEMAVNKNRFEAATQQFRDLEREYQMHLNYYRNANPRNGRYLFIGTDEKLEQMGQNELVRFAQVFSTTEKLSATEVAQGKLYPASYDVLIYRSNAIKGEDGLLERIVSELRPYTHIALVVYAANREEWLDGNTKNVFDSYPLTHIANNQISLIDNVAAAYRTCKLLAPQNV